MKHTALYKIYMIFILNIDIAVFCKISRAVKALIFFNALINA